MKRVTKVTYDSGTLSAPAWIDVWLEDGTHWWKKGKAAKAAFANYQQIKVGSYLDPAMPGWHLAEEEQ